MGRFSLTLPGRFLPNPSVARPARRARGLGIGAPRRSLASSKAESFGGGMKRPPGDKRPLRRLGESVLRRVSADASESEAAIGQVVGDLEEISAGTATPPDPPLSWDGEPISLHEGIGFGFSAGGLLFPYFVGNAVALKRLGLVTDTTVFAGSSAGSLISTCLVCDLEVEDLMGALLEMYKQLRDEGTVGNVRKVVETYANMVFPEDAHIRAKERLNVSIVRMSAQTPFMKSLYVNDFESKEDLIQALLTSSHVPLYMNTRVTSTFRGQTCVDGGLGTNFIPVPPCTEPVTICCFPNMPFECDIAPGKFSECKYSLRKMLQFAILPPSEDKIIELFEMGVTDVLDWATHVNE